MWTVDNGISVLRKRGAKVTAQRIAIMRNLQGREDHPSVDTIYKELAVDYPTMSVATVYSTAQLLAEAGLIKILSIDDKRIYFDPNTDTHGHFLCKKCRKVSDFKIDEASLFRSAASSENNISQIEAAEIFFYGLCTDCLTI